MSSQFFSVSQKKIFHAVCSEMSEIEETLCAPTENQLFSVCY